MSGRTLRNRLRACLLSLVLATGAPPILAADFARARQEMVATIEQSVLETSRYLGRESLNPGVMAAMGRVSRHEFVPQSQRQAAYDNRPLPIGHGQTISQPYIVAIMTDLLDLKPSHKALEIGTGSGYQAAILAELVERVHTMEIIEPLARLAHERLQQLGYANVHTRFADGYHGWPEHGPYDAIVVTAAASHVPPPLIRQLKPGGRMMIPVGSRFLTQQLLLIEKQPDGGIVTRQILPVRFVPLTGDHE